MGSRRATPTVLTTYQAAARKYATNKELNKLNELLCHEQNRVLSGLIVGAPTTPSSQATGAGETVWNVDISAGIVIVGGVAKEYATQADVVVHNTTQYTGLDSGKSAIATIVAKNDTGVISLAIVKGAAALDGAQVAPTDGEINTAVGAGVNWVKIAECLLQRTGDLVVVQTQNNILRPMLGVTVSTSFNTTT